MTPGRIYAFAATSFNANGQESDFSEVIYYNVPEVEDSDGDGLSDEEETETYGTDPNNPDTDGDGTNDGDEVAYWGDDWDADYDKDGTINLLDPDADCDSLADEEEIDSGENGVEATLLAVYTLLLDS